MTPTATLRPAFVESFPTDLDPAVLYISMTYGTCSHLCCCGCGQEVVTPLSPAQWSLTYDGENISLTPSIGNWALPCQSHYWIHKSEIRWSRRYSSAEIDATRDRDRRALSITAEETSPTLLARLTRRWRKLR